MPCCHHLREVEIPYLTRNPIDPAVLLAEVGGPGRGGTTLFVGSVRQSPEDGPVVEIDYTAYEPMAEAEFERILREASDRWPEARIAARHRLGVVPLGEASVVVAAAAPHRGQSFDACRWVIEEVKRRLPVWKRERLADGAEQWSDNAGARHPTGPRSSGS